MSEVTDSDGTTLVLCGVDDLSNSVREPLFRSFGSTMLEVKQNHHERRAVLTRHQIVSSAAISPSEGSTGIDVTDAPSTALERRSKFLL